MLAVSAILPDTVPDHPPVILIHGAANSATVWKFWQPELAAQGWPSYAIDLRGHGQSGPLWDLSQTSMQDYAADVAGLVTQFRAAGPHRLAWADWWR
jgi:pimeloyl-ACP methyl ester carboxylesterase